MLAAELPDVLVEDADPLVGGGVGDHLLDQLAVARLDVDSVVQAPLDVLPSRPERIPYALELVHGQRPRSAPRAPNSIRWQGKADPNSRASWSSIAAICRRRSARAARSSYS